MKPCSDLGMGDSPLHWPQPTSSVLPSIRLGAALYHRSPRTPPTGLPVRVRGTLKDRSLQRAVHKKHLSSRGRFRLGETWHMEPIEPAPAGGPGAQKEGSASSSDFRTEVERQMFTSPISDCRSGCIVGTVSCTQRPTSPVLQVFLLERPGLQAVSYPLHSLWALAT